jgi:asparagine N-glycosylation enzyme membrane subunit Stt3
MKLKLTIGILTLALVLSVLFRIVLPLPDVFSGDKVLLTEVDAYYQSILAESSARNDYKVPESIPELRYPDGLKGLQRPFMPVFTAWISNTFNVPLDVVGAYFPAICGILLIIPVFVIGALVFGLYGGLFSALFIAIIGGDFLNRTSLGHYDHHATEVLFATLVVMFTILAMKRNLWWSIGGGIFLGFHLLNWAGGPLMIIILLLYFVIQSVINQYKKQSNRTLSLAVLLTVVIGVATSIMSFVGDYEAVNIYRLFFTSVPFIPLVVMGLSYLLRREHWGAYLCSLIGLACGILLIMQFIYPDTIGLIGNFIRFFGGGESDRVSQTVIESQPLDFRLYWGNFYVMGVIAGMGLIYYTIKGYGGKVKVLMIVWGLVTVIMAFLQRRFVYYLGVEVALFAGFLCWYIVEVACRRTVKEKIGHGKKSQTIKKRVMQWSNSIIPVSLIIALLVVPSVITTWQSARNHPFQMSKGWIESTQWLKGQPKGDYSVLSWWDYGYWITKETGLNTVADPGGGPLKELGTFLTNPTTDRKFLEKYKVKYLVIDVPMVMGKSYAFYNFAGRDLPETNEGGLFYKVYNGLNSDFKLVFESKTMYGKTPEVRVFEVK